MYHHPANKMSQSPQQSFACAIRQERGGFLALFATFTIFLLTIAAYGGLILLNRTQSKALHEITSQIQQKEEIFEDDSIKEILLLDYRLKNIRSLLTQHLFVSNLFHVIEADTLPQTNFLDFNFLAKERMITLKGETFSYALLAQQMTIFEDDPGIEQAVFEGLSRSGDSKVQFELKLTLKPSLLQAKPSF